MPFFMGGGVPGFPLTRAGLSIVADFDDELWMKATGAARVKGTRAAAGLAVVYVSDGVNASRTKFTYRAGPGPLSSGRRRTWRDVEV